MVATGTAAQLFKRDIALGAKDDGDLLSRVEIVLNPSQAIYERLCKQYHQSESWPVCKQDYASWQSGFAKFWLFVAIEKASGDPVGSISLALYGRKLAELYAIGLYYVRTDYRRSGLGTLLFDRAFALRGATNVGLCGVPHMSARYAARYGFEHYMPYRHHQLTFSPEDITVREAPKLDGVSIASVDFSDGDFVHQLLAYDSSVVGTSTREDFLRAFLSQKGAFSRVAVGKSDGKVIGFINARECEGTTLVVGPWYADSTEVAHALLASLLAEGIPLLTIYNSIIVLLPSTNDIAKKVTQSICGNRARLAFSCYIQFTQHTIETKADKIFGILDCIHSHS